MAGNGSTLWRVDAGAMPGCPLGSVVWFVNDGPSARVLRQGLGQVAVITSPGTTQTASPDGTAIRLVNEAEGWHAQLSRLPAASEQRLANWEMGRTGIPGLSDPRRAAFEVEVRAGGRLIIYQWAASAVLVSFKRPSEIKLVKRGQNAVLAGLPYSLASLLFGWWGIPWGPIYTISSIWRNTRGGHDVTRIWFPDLPSVPSPSTEAATKRSSGLPPSHH
jgi:hypothetical protein